MSSFTTDPVTNPLTNGATIDAELKARRVQNNLLIQAKEAKEAKNSEETVGHVGKLITSATDTIAEVEAQIIGAETKVATIGAVAVAKAAADTINTQGPTFMETLRSAINFLYKGKNMFAKEKANSEVEKLKIKEQSDAEQIRVLMETGLTKAAAKEKYDKIEAKREKKEDTKLRIEEAAAATAAAIKIAKTTGGGRNIITLHQIQKGGRQSAKRTKKSINEFLNTSVTSSQILNMISNPGHHKENTKGKRKRNNGKYSRRIRAKKMD
jgi:hypothetical protein